MTAPRIFSRAVAVAALATLTLGLAQAQPRGPSPQSTAPPNALQGFSQNRDEPVKIQADSLVVRSNDKVATFSGNVHVTQGDTEMRSKVLTVFYEDGSKDSAKPGQSPPPAMKAAQPGPAGQQQIRRIEATGGVLVTQKEQNAAGDTGIFDMPSNTVTLSGNVVVTRGKDVMRGHKLIVDLTTGVSKIESGGGQVEGLFQSSPHGDIGFPGATPKPQHP